MSAIRRLLQVGLLGFAIVSPALAQPSPATQPSTKPAAALDLRDPKSAASSFGAALLRGDADSALAASFGAEDRQTLIRQYVPVIGALRELSEAASAKWGRDNVLSKSVAGRTIAVELEGAEVKVEGDTASVSRPGTQGTLKLAKKQGVWKVDLDQLPVQQMEMALQMAPVLTAAAKETATEILADRHQNAPAAQEAFVGKVYAGMLAPPPKK